jgi:hypothetical protein
MFLKAFDKLGVFNTHNVNCSDSVAFQIVLNDDSERDPFHVDTTTLIAWSNMESAYCSSRLGCLVQHYRV